MEKYNNQENDIYLLHCNLLGFKTYEALEEAEAFVFSIRAAELERKEYSIDRFTAESFKKLHHHLFQDIYPFAGQFRDVQLMKGSTRFCQAQFIKSYSSDLFDQINKERVWQSLEDAAGRLAYYKSELNMLHPFREGNGRTIRIFLRAYASSKGVNWEYEKMDGKKYLQAMVQSVTDLDLLRQVFRETIFFNE